MNAEINCAVVEGLVKRGIKVLAMRCAGYNNVNFKAAYEAGLTIVRVPAYSPYAVDEHAAALLMTLTRHIHRLPAPRQWPLSWLHLTVIRSSNVSYRLFD